MQRDDTKMIAKLDGSLEEKSLPNELKTVPQINIKPFDGIVTPDDRPSF